MKVALLTVSLLFSIGQLCAQEISYWVGTSTNSNPIKRNNEAFMDAFSRYVLNTPTDGMNKPAAAKSEQKGTPGLSFNTYEDDCRIEIVSSAVCDGGEIMTISIGKGLLAHYKYALESSKTAEGVVNTALLIITYTDDSKKEKTIHNFFRIEHPDAENEFTYSCSHSNVEE